MTARDRFRRWLKRQFNEFVLFIVSRDSDD